MKKLLFAMLSLVTFMLNGADLRIVGGKIYCNVEITKAAAGYVQIEHDDGTATLSLDELPENFIAAMSPHQRMALQEMADIQIPGGKFYAKTTIAKLEDKKVYLTHLKGKLVILFDKLPASYRSTFTRKQLAELNKVPAKARKIKRKDVVTGERTPDNDIIYRGPRGGKYFIDDRGKKVYIRSDQ